MRSVLVRGFKSRVRFLGFATLLVGAVTPVTSAWGQEGRQLPVRGDAMAPNAADFADLRQASEFDLFGDADLAMIGTRARGSMVHNLPNDGGLLDYYFVLSSGNVFQRNTPRGTMQAFFMGSLYLGAPRSEWEMARQEIPSLSNALGGGWVSTFNVDAWFFRVPAKWTPADDQLGLVHSGASMETGGGCLDFSDDFVNDGAPLMASSDCPETWGSDQFAGASRLIPVKSWEAYFNSVAPSEFSWDWWKVPPEFVSDGLIGDWQTYGKIVDWGTDVLGRYGSVMPGGEGDPEEWGWPMGISIYFDVYSFQNPAIANATFFRGLIVNESEQLYGVPLDYDSLYFGVEKGELMSQQSSSTFFRPDLGGAYMVNNGVNAGCNGALSPSGVPGCRAGGSSAGFNQGAVALLFLNSPMGDLRNKHFSDPASTFYAPGHPLAGDTITFNQGRKGGWGAQYQPTTFRSARSGYGYHAGVIPDLLDGRSEADYDANAGWFTTFNNYDYPNRTAQFNKYVPAEAWDWNGDGVQDTLTLVSCLGPEFGAPGAGGCAELWSDTLPGRLNNGGGNFGGFIGFGPFALAAGDSARFTWAVVTGESQAAIEINTRNVIATYMNAYLRPNPATAPRIVSVATTPGDRGRTPGATVQLFWDDSPEEWVDEFMLFTADQLEGTALATDNPWLQDSLRAQATNNVAAIHIFKSCDFGQGFTNDTNCQDDPAVDATGTAIDLGWQPYETFPVDENGGFPNAFVDLATTPGKTYLYSIVTETKGFTVNVFDRDEDGNLIPATVTLVPRLFNVLSTSSSDPNVVEPYVPASRQAGGRAAEVEFTLDDPLAPSEYYDIEVLLTSDIDEAAGYRVVFGDSVVVSTDGETWTVEVNRSVTTSTDGGATLERVVYETDTYTTQNESGVQVAGGVTDSGTGTTVFADELTLVTLASDEPLFASSVLDGSSTTPGSFLGRADFPRFLLNVDNSNAGDFESQNWFQIVSADSSAQLRTGNTSASPTLEWMEQLVEPTGESFNTYIIEFEDHEYGPGNAGTGNGLFVISLRDPESTDQDFQESLDLRTVATTTSTTAEVAAALGVAQEDLIAVDLPFTVRHEDPDREVIAAMLAEDKLQGIPLGQNVDQITVTVPEDKWVPGEPIMLLETVRTFQRAEGTAGEYVVTDGSGQPVVVDTMLVSWAPAVLGCEQRVTCNPVQAGTRGANSGAHLPAAESQFLRVRYLDTLTPATQYGYSVTATLTGSSILEIPQADLDSIFVVPNPYVVFSAYEQNQGDRRLLFRGLPACPAAAPCSIEIYTVSGQFVQRVTYDIDDLAGNGDLFWNMRTRENTDIQSGLYIFVVSGATASDGTGQSFKHLGKFVVIR